MLALGARTQMLHLGLPSELRLTQVDDDEREMLAWRESLTLRSALPCASYQQLANNNAVSRTYAVTCALGVAR